MSKSQDRVEARRAIQERAIARRREREQQDERVAKLALDVNVALREGRRAVEAAERRAGRALTLMITTEGLAVTEVIDWVGDSTLTAREIARLRGLAIDSRGTWADNVSPDPPSRQPDDEPDTKGP